MSPILRTRSPWREVYRLAFNVRPAFLLSRGIDETARTEQEQVRATKLLTLVDGNAKPAPLFETDTFSGSKDAQGRARTLKDSQGQSRTCKDTV
jgi:hypothetical protein